MRDLLHLLLLDKSNLDRFSEDPPEVRRRARLVSIFGLLAFTGGTTLATTHFFFFRISFPLVVPPLLAGLLGLVGPSLLLRRRKLQASGHVLALCWLIACGWGAFLRGGLASPPMMAQISVPFIALVLIGPRAAGLWSVAVLAEFVIYGVLPAAGIELPDRMAPAWRVSSNIVASGLFFTLVMAMAFALEWLRVKAEEELAEVQGKKVAAELDAQLLRADRLVSLGQLAASIAHEINNPLAYVMGSLEFLAAAAPGGELGEAVSDALDGASRVRTIVGDLKTFSRADDEQRVRVDLEKVVTSSLRMVAGEARGRAVLRTEFCKCPAVLASETRLAQIVVNLVVNAVQAMAPLEPQRSEREIVVSLGTAADGSAQLAVRDNGAGIPAELLGRVTEPFFTTKPVGVGTGLGLSVCANLVKRFAGSLKIASRVGEGTTVTILLPAAPIEPVLGTAA